MPEVQEADMSDAKSLVMQKVFSAQVFRNRFGAKDKFRVQNGRKALGPWRDSEQEAWEAANQLMSEAKGHD